MELYWHQLTNNQQITTADQMARLATEDMVDIYDRSLEEISRLIEYEHFPIHALFKIEAEDGAITVTLR